MSAIPQTDNELLGGFVDEAIESLQSLNDLLEEHRTSGGVTDAIHRVFRSIHSIKGNAGFFGLSGIKQFSHAMENTLDEIRNNRIALTEELHRRLTLGFDQLGEMLQVVSERGENPDLSERETELLAAIATASKTEATETSSEDQLLCVVREIMSEMASSGLATAASWVSRLEDVVPADPSGAGSASQPQAFEAFATRSLNLGGEDVTSLFQPLFAPFVAVRDRQYEKSIGEAFLSGMDKVVDWSKSKGDSEFATDLATAKNDFTTLHNSSFDMDATLLGIVWDRLAPHFVRVFGASKADPKVAVAEATTAASSQPSAAHAPDAPHHETHGPESHGPDTHGNDPAAANRVKSVRVREDKLDVFVDDVSKLFIICERLKDLHSRFAVSARASELVEELRQINSTFSAQTTSLQNSVVALRRVPAAGLLQKFPRMARTLASKLGKQLDVHLAGEDVEIDKSLAEDLDAPLTHMVRNVCDHAIELPSDRTVSGKAESGNLWLKCELSKTHVILTARDDGRGIDPVRLRRKAVEKGVLPQSVANELSDQDAVELIFHPGFSTAEKVTEVSGRGVGLDVVRTKLREYGGDVKVESQIGQGTTFHLEIPIRRAVVVIEALTVGVADNEFVLPFEHIREIVELDSTSLTTVQSLPVATLRDRTYAAVYLGQVLGLCDRETAEQNALQPDGKRLGVIVKTKLGEACLVVENVFGQRKVVVNSIGDQITVPDMIGGVSQMGGGRLALVLSAPDIIRTVSTASARRGPTAS